MSGVWMVDATPARQQLRELAAWGFPAAWIADRLGMGRSGVIAIRNGNRPMTHPYTARAIARLHNELAGANPADHGISKQAITRTQWLPLTRGWAA